MRKLKGRQKQQYILCSLQVQNLMASLAPFQLRFKRRKCSGKKNPVRSFHQISHPCSKFDYNSVTIYDEDYTCVSLILSRLAEQRQISSSIPANPLMGTKNWPATSFISLSVSAPVRKR